MTNVLGYSTETNSPPCSQSPQVAYYPCKLRQPTAHTIISFLKVGSRRACSLPTGGCPSSCISTFFEMATVTGHAGILTDRSLPSTGVFLFSGQHHTVRLHPGLRGGGQARGPRDILTSKQPNFSFWGAEKKVPDSSGCMGIWPVQPGTLRGQE